MGDGYITDAGPVEDLRHVLATVEQAARDAGRDPDALGLALLQNAFAWDGVDAWSVVREGVAHQLGAYEAWGADSDTPSHDALEIPPQDDSELRRWTPAGTPAQVVQALRPLVEEFGRRGELHLIVRLHYPGMNFETAARALELFGEDVIPALKGS